MPKSQKSKSETGASAASTENSSGASTENSRQNSENWNQDLDGDEDDQSDSLSDVDDVGLEDLVKVHEGTDKTLSNVWDGGVIQHEAEKHGAGKTGFYANKCGINPYLINI